MNDTVIYTCLTGGYDKLPQYDVIDSEFDYICFSNEFPENSRQGIWVIRPIPFENDDNIRTSRYVKLLPHHVLKNYKYSLWLDSNLIITDSSIYELIKSRIKEGGMWYGIKHPDRDCIYDEAITCFCEARTELKETKRQMDFLRMENYPKHYGLFENNLILRKHNDEAVKGIDECWWKLFQKYTKRDQLSLFYVFWEKSFSPKLFVDEGITTRNIGGIIHNPHSKRAFTQRVHSYLKRKYNKFIIKFISM